MNRLVFDARHAAALHRAARANVLLAFDFDGTLAPITDRPADARLRSTTRALLQQAASLYRTVVLTGRSRADTVGRLSGVAVAAVIGNHGLEGAGGRTPARAIVRRWRGALAPLRRLPGVTIEDKGASLAVHFRGASRPQALRRRILRAASALSPRPRAVGGKAIVNLLPDVGVNKGTALRTLMRRWGVRGAIYVGDDVTDEDVFELPSSARVLTIRVGRARDTTARYHIASQRQIDLLLALLIEARTPA